MDDERRVVGEPPPSHYRSWMLRCDRDLRASVRSGRRRLQRARDATRTRAALEGAVIRFGGRSCTAAHVGAVAGSLAFVHAEDARYLPRPVRFVGRGLTAVNFVTLTLLFADILGLDPSEPRLEPLAIAAALAGCGTAAGVILALDVGRRLRPGTRISPVPEPPVPALLGAGVLMLLGGLAFASSVAWAQKHGSGPAATAAGLILGTAALAGPLMVLADEVYGAGPDGRRLTRAERLLTRWHRRARRAERRARGHLDAADRTVWRAESVLASLADVLGSRHRMVVGLTAAVDFLRAEAVDARRRLDEFLAPVAPEDLDLAG